MLTHFQPQRVVVVLIILNGNKRKLINQVLKVNKKTLTLDICIIKRTTKERKPSRFRTLGPFRISLMNFMSQKTLCSRSLSWELRKLTKWRISDQDGSAMPQFLGRIHMYVSECVCVYVRTYNFTGLRASRVIIVYCYSAVSYGWTIQNSTVEINDDYS